MHVLPSIFGVFVAVAYIAIIITIIIYLIRLFRRLVIGVEKIANCLENSGKDKFSQPIEQSTSNT
jgi:hypothetical protein